MNSTKLIQLLNNKFPFEPTSQQTEVIKQLSEFVENSSSNSLFLLKGYAGTGKTTLVSSLINSLWSVGKKVVLLAPTGRAAKVLSVYSKKSAFTIHKKFIGCVPILKVIPMLLYKKTSIPILFL